MCHFGKFYFLRNAVLFILIAALFLLFGGSVATTACGSAGKESACIAGGLGSIPGLRRSPGEGKGRPLQDSGLGESRGLCSPWGHKGWDTPERLSLCFTFTRTSYS